MRPGIVYLAPDDRHLRLRSRSMLAPVDAPPRGHHRPSIDELFDSAADHLGTSAIAILLTGMGSDGAAGLGNLRRAGALTLAQQPSTCVVESMPRSAIESGAVCSTLVPQAIAPAVMACMATSTRIARLVGSAMA